MIARYALVLAIAAPCTAWSDAAVGPGAPAAVAGVEGGCVYSVNACRCFGPSGAPMHLPAARCELVAAPPVGVQLGGGDLRRYEHVPLHLPVDTDPLRAPARPRGVGYALDAARSISRGAR